MVHLALSANGKPRHWKERGEKNLKLQKKGLCEHSQYVHSPSPAYSAVSMATRQKGWEGGHPTASPDYVIKGRPPPPHPRRSSASWG